MPPRMFGAVDSHSYPPQWVGLEHIGRAWAHSERSLYPVYAVAEDGYLYYLSPAGERIQHAQPRMASIERGYYELPQRLAVHPIDTLPPEGM